MHRRIALVVSLTAVLAVGIYASVAMAGSRPAKVKMTISVSMIDYGFKLTKKAVKAGTTVTFVVKNNGRTVHNFDLSGLKATPVAGPGSIKRLTVTFKKAGRVQYVCDVPRHAELGMAGTFNVT